ncbi:sugar transferase [Horticoccus luteus]|uniref:sugar transferase n=1 Tax=Horticoccus luteus TaxID=2862869 RepID=UPI00295ECEEF|nr:sugar transferase [Horticoccus luteus]
MKRGFDLTLVVLSAPVWVPVLAVVGLLVRINLGSPVLFRQRRPGRNAAIFELIKFRTMTSARDAEGRLLPDAMRLTRFGRWLRATSLDELPELINVLRGEMSLVGPRPLLVDYLPRYSARQARRHEVPPGLTGLAQISGRNALGWEQKFECDVRYVETRSIGLDVRILALTIYKVLRREGISAAGDATMPEFKPVASDVPTFATEVTESPSRGHGRTL